MIAQTGSAPPTDPTSADAILDRLIHNAHRIDLKGEPMRKRKPQNPGAET